MSWPIVGLDNYVNRHRLVLSPAYYPQRYFRLVVGIHAPDEVDGRGDVGRLFGHERSDLLGREYDSGRCPD